MLRLTDRLGTHAQYEVVARPFPKESQVMTPLTRRGIGLLVWSGTAYGVLSLRNLPGEYSHYLCGPWGCLPPIQALLAVHGFWGVVIAPFVWRYARLRTRRELFRAGGWLSSLALLGILCSFAYTWWGLRDYHVRSFVTFYLGRALGGLATQTDLPLVQIWIAGIALIALGLRSNIEVSDAAPENAHSKVASVLDR